MDTEAYKINEAKRSCDNLRAKYNEHSSAFRLIDDLEQKLPTAVDPIALYEKCNECGHLVDREDSDDE